MSASPATPPLSLFLYSLCPLYSAHFLQAAATLQLKPRPIWLATFLEASQPKLQHLDAQQLASLASAVAALSASAAAPGSSKEQKQRDSGARVSGSWVKVWMDCSKLRLSELQKNIREQEQQQAKQEAAANPSDGTPAEAAQKGGKAATAAASVAANPAPGVLIGQLALSAVELGVLSKPLPATAAKSSAGGVLPQSFGPTTAERVAWIAALAAAAATAAAAVRTKALNAASASQILSALTAQQQEQPGLLQQLDAQFKQQAGSSSGASYVLSVVAAVASAAKGSMWSGGWEVLVRLLWAMLVFGVQPGEYQLTG